MRRMVPLVLLLAACGQQSLVDTTTEVEAASTRTIETTTTTEATSTSAAGPTTTAAPETTATLAPLEGIAYEPVATGLPFPILLTARPGETDPVIATKGGIIWRLGDDGPVEILDIEGLVRNEGEQGLLGLAFHPSDPERVFVHYSDGDGATVVAEYGLDGWKADPDSAMVLFSQEQPASNHNGGMIQFGPDGGLYLGLGDGGGAGDQFGNGQRDDTMLAGLVRIDPDSGEAEKFAKGLRNPWRFWIDGETIYIGDVGQGSYEEISVAPLTSGLNYGWPVTEGLHCYSPRRGCDPSGTILPVVEIEHGDAGTCSVTGGVVYRGGAIPELAGHYFYSDYCGGYLRSFRLDAGAASDTVDWTDQVGVPGPIVSFGLDAAGEMYVVTTDSIHRVVPVR